MSERFKKRQERFIEAESPGASSVVLCLKLDKLNIICQTRQRRTTSNWASVRARRRTTMNATTRTRETPFLMSGISPYSELGIWMKLVHDAITANERTTGSCKLAMLLPAPKNDVEARREWGTFSLVLRELDAGTSVSNFMHLVGEAARMGRELLLEDGEMVVASPRLHFLKAAGHEMEIVRRTSRADHPHKTVEYTLRIYPIREQGIPQRAKADPFYEGDGCTCY